MSKLEAYLEPPDQPQRDMALDPSRSILVQAPAGSGKTDLLTRRFLRLLAEVDQPGQVVAITFTNAAAAEMRHRILSELEKASDTGATAPIGSEFSLDCLARRALEHSRALGWKLLDLPAQLRISTIDSFCRDLALQQPLLSGLGGGLDIAQQPTELYRRAARKTLQQIDEADPVLSASIEALLLWRDNNWQDLEDQLVEMLCKRDRWMHGFVLGRELDLDALRLRLERPFANAVREALSELDRMFDGVPGTLKEVLDLARFACNQGGNHLELAELVEFPSAPFTGSEALEEGRGAYLGLAALLLTGGGTFRKLVDKRLGFPADCKSEKRQLLDLIARLRTIPNLESALASVGNLPPTRYTEDDWQIVRACFTMLRQAAAELKVVFAEAGAVDFIEVAQIAQRVLSGDDGQPTDAAMAIADSIRHLLVDEFQDTSRRQHQLLANLIAAWPDRTGRSCFVVGDPMQSIYFFRDADAELFPRVQNIGLEIPDGEPLLFHFVPLKANFRTAPPLVGRLNDVFEQIFAANDGSGVTFSSAEPFREVRPNLDPYFKLHLNFIAQTTRVKSVISDSLGEKDAARAAQAQQIVELIRGHIDRMEQARARGGKYRIAVLGRSRNALAPVALALREAEIPFRAVDLEKLAARPEVLDVLALARALLNPHDRVAWLGVLRAPWCGLSLDDLHQIASADDPELLTRPVPELLAERLYLLSAVGCPAAERVLGVLSSVPSLRASQSTASLGTFLEQVWLHLGGSSCVDGAARINLDLLWSCLDRLPNGELDLLGPALDTALDKLTAQPDPAASQDCGVQLMTIHKSKGQEFEVVIVPDLQAGGGRSGRNLLSWLERGLTRADESGEITEFLIAPLQPKGADRGRSKAWVDQIYRERESQEMRRILYVAATRAREELHLFARPAYKLESNGDFTLVDPSNSLLATAWPAFQEEIQGEFEKWKAVPEEEVISIAASGQGNLLTMPSPVRPTVLRRLPPDFLTAPSRVLQDSILRPAERIGSTEPGAPVFASETWENALYPRHEGGLLSRALGTAVHSFLEQLARLRLTNDWGSARAELNRFEPRIAAQARATGTDQAQAAGIAAEALRHTLNVSLDPLGQWILSPHPEGASEVSWAGIVAGSLRTVRVDRVFGAGPTPLSEGSDCLWIIDYKTAHAPDAALSDLRRLFRPQIEAYAAVIRNLRGKDAVLRAGLYYPRTMLLDWWEP